jgi:hypothetical protein
MSGLGNGKTFFDDTGAIRNAYQGWRNRWNFVAIWWAYGFSTGVWTLGSSMIAAGLTAGQAIVRDRSAFLCFCQQRCTASFRD